VVPNDRQRFSQALELSADAGARQGPSQRSRARVARDAHVVHDSRNRTTRTCRLCKRPPYHRIARNETNARLTLFTASRPSVGRSSLVLVSLSHHEFGCRRETAVPPNCANETGALRSRQMSREFVSARKLSLLDSRKGPELTEEFEKQKSQKREVRQIFNSWRRERDSNHESSSPYLFETPNKFSHLGSRDILAPIDEPVVSRSN
jgi:hypothetical protein